MGSIRSRSSGDGAGGPRRRWSVLLLGLVALTLVAPMDALAANRAPNVAGDHATADRGRARPVGRVIMGGGARPQRVATPPALAGARMSPSLAGAPSVAGSVSSASPAGATVINYTFTGFPTAARTAVLAALALWAGVLRTTQPIKMTFFWQSVEGNQPALLGAGYWAQLADGYSYPSAVGEAVCRCNLGDGTDVTGAFNSGYAWYYGLDGKPPTDRYDMVTVAIREIGRALGIQSTYQVISGTGLAQWGAGAGRRLRFDDAVRSAATGGSRLNDTTFVANDSAALAAQLTDGSVYFGGSAAVAMNDGARPRLYAPNPWDPYLGTALLQRTPTLDPVAINMSNEIKPGEVIQAVGQVVAGMMEDVGWTTFLPDTSKPTWSGSISPGSRVYRSNPDFIRFDWSPASDVLGLPLRPYVGQASIAPLLADGTCGQFVAGDLTEGRLPSAKVTNVPPNSCVRFRVYAQDRRGNRTDAITSGVIVYDNVPPTAAVTLTESSPNMAVKGTTLAVSNLDAGEQFRATYTPADRSPIDTVGCGELDGFTVEVSPSVDYQCIYTATGFAFGASTITAPVTDVAGNEGVTDAFDIAEDFDGPTAAFSKPSGAVTAVNTTSIQVAWTEADVSGVEDRVMRRQSGAQVTPGSCAGVTYTLDSGYSEFDPAPVGSGSLVGATCYRWRLTLTDPLGNQRITTSGPLLVDLIAPFVQLAPSSDSPNITVADGTVYLDVPPAAGEQLIVGVTVQEQGSGLDTLACADVPGFSKQRTGAFPSFTCTYTALGAGYADASMAFTATDVAGNLGGADFFVIPPDVPALDPLPAGWATRDIGPVGITGEAGIVAATGAFQATGAGLGFSGTSDSFRFTSQAMSGDGSLSIRLLDQVAATTKGFAGVMVREGNGTGARFVFVGRRADGSIVAVRRTTAGARPIVTVAPGGTVSLPVDLRIRRTGNVLVAQYRPLGGAWTRVTSITVALAATTRAGVAVTSRSTTSASVATWDQVAFVP